LFVPQIRFICQYDPVAQESNFKLTQGIEEAIQKISDKNSEISSMQLSVEAEKRTVSDKLTRHEATQAQQTKLIDFLQTKVDINAQNNKIHKKYTFPISNTLHPSR
jgi:hypothetical protein